MNKVLFEVALRVYYTNSSKSTQPFVYVAAKDIAEALTHAQPTTGYSSFEVRGIREMGPVQVITP